MIERKEERRKEGTEAGSGGRLVVRASCIT